MLSATNIGVLGSTFDDARRLGFLDRARQKEQERAGSGSRRRLATEKFPIQDGVDLLINGFGKAYADGYRLGVAESSQPASAQNGSESDSDDEQGQQTVGEVFRNSIKASISKDCKVLRRQIEASMKQGMAEYATRKATNKFARVYGWDVVFNINSPLKTRKEINGMIEREANETCKKLRKTRKWDSYPSHAVQETLRRIKNRIVDAGISEYAKKKIEKAKKKAEKAVFVSEDKIVSDAIAATDKIREFCREWKQEVERWKSEFTDPIPKEAIFVENHEHMANEVSKLLPIMHLLFPDFEIDEKLTEHELWADAVALADPYADNHPDYEPLDFLRGWSAGGIKLLLMHMQRQINKIERTFEKIIVVDPEFVDDVIDERQQNLAKKEQLEALRAREAEEKRRLEKQKRRKQRELARAKREQEEHRLEEKRKKLLAEKKEARRKERAARKAADLLRQADLEQLAENLDKANEDRRKEATRKAGKIPRTAKEFMKRREDYKDSNKDYGFSDDYWREQSSEESEEESEESEEESEEDELEDEIPELEQDIAETNKAIASREAVITSADSALENLPAGPSAPEILANAKKSPAWHDYTEEEFETATWVARYDELDLLFEDTHDIEALEEIKKNVQDELQGYAPQLDSQEGYAPQLDQTEDLKNWTYEEQVEDLLRRIEERIEEKQESDFEEASNDAMQENNETESIIYEDADNAVESLWAAMKLKDKYFKSDEERADIVDRLVRENLEEIETSEFFNRRFVREVLAFYEKANKPAADLRTRWDMLLQYTPSSFESSLAGSVPVAQAMPVAMPMAMPVATAWKFDHVKQHREHFARTMFKKCASLMSRFAPKKLKMKFAPRPASVGHAVAIPLTPTEAHVFETKKFAPMKIHLDADAPRYTSDIMSR